MSTPQVTQIRKAPPRNRRRESWAYEKGLPRICRAPLQDRLGRTILVATDLGDASHEVEARAMELAAQVGARLIVLAVPLPTTAAQEALEKRLETLLVVARQRGVDAEGRLVTGDPAETILHVAAASHATSIIIGHQQWPASTGGECICGHLTLHAACPVLITGTARAS